MGSSIAGELPQPISEKNKGQRQAPESGGQDRRTASPRDAVSGQRFSVYLDRPNQVTVDYASQGGLSPQNRLNTLFSIEGKIKKPMEIMEAIDKLAHLVKAIIDEFEQNPGRDRLTIPQQIEIAFIVIEKEGYLLRRESPLFTDSLNSKKLDCDTSSFVILALADELKSKDPRWNGVGLVNIPGHTFLSVKVDNNAEQYVDFGKPRTKAYYENFFNIPVGYPFVALRGNQVISNFYFNRGVSYLETSQPALAVKDFTQAMKDAPDDPVLFLNRGIAYAKWRKFSLAISDFTESIRLNPGSYKAYYVRALAHKQNGDAALFEADFAKAESLKPH